MFLFKTHPITAHHMNVLKTDPRGANHIANNRKHRARKSNNANKPRYQSTLLLAHTVPTSMPALRGPEPFAAG